MRAVILESIRIVWKLKHFTKEDKENIFTLNTNRLSSFHKTYTKASSINKTLTICRQSKFSK